MIKHIHKRTALYHDDADVSDAGHRDVWVAEDERVSEACLTVALGLTVNEVARLRRECRKQKRRPSAVIAEWVKERLALGALGGDPAVS